MNRGVVVKKFTIKLLAEINIGSSHIYPMPSILTMARTALEFLGDVHGDSAHQCCNPWRFEGGMGMSRMG